MGDLKVIKLTSKEDKANYIHQLVRDIEALDQMIAEGLIEKEPIRIGAEQEFCLVDEQFNPKMNSLEILEDIDDDHFTTEIGSFNLELNLDPFELKGDCFSKLANQLKTLMLKGKEAAKKHNARILLTGILPTLSLRHIKLENMTDVQRYFVLNDAIRESRKDNFEIHIKGVDELNLLHDSVLLEGCNTSFQIHLQINPDEFIDSYNWAQAISGPVLSACTNSPLLFGKELWSETRIASFTQSVDTRANSFMLNEKQSRVSFGSEWTSGTVSDIFKDNISRFRSLVTAEYFKDSVDMLKAGEIPKLKALNLHNGTVYRWNRPCYGVGGGKPHLRIENRYIPSGPTIADEIANTMFWVGIMKGRPKEYEKIDQKMNFKDAKSNFFNAARYGMSTQFIWDNEFVPSHKLILDVFLPMAYRGLYSVGINPQDAEKYLTIIENRVKGFTGSEWLTASYRNLLSKMKPFEAAQTLTAHLYEKQETNFPVSSWRILDRDTQSLTESDKKVEHIMSTDIFTVYEKDSVELVINIMRWKNVHHMPVINSNKQVVGVLRWSDLEAIIKDGDKLKSAVGDIMRSDFPVISQGDSVKTAVEMLEKYNTSCLPVTRDDQLIGIVTLNDL